MSTCLFIQTFNLRLWDRNPSLTLHGNTIICWSMCRHYKQKCWGSCNSSFSDSVLLLCFCNDYDYCYFPPHFCISSSSHPNLWLCMFYLVFITLRDTYLNCHRKTNSSNCLLLLLFVFERRSVCQYHEYSMAEENFVAQRQTAVTACNCYLSLHGGQYVSTRLQKRILQLKDKQQ